MVYIIPAWRPGNFLATSLLFAGIAIIAFAMGKYLSGDSDKIMLVVVAIIIVGLGLLFYLAPLGI